jgi:molybdopterin-guanine dinucleotide biosynthesis protein A
MAVRFSAALLAGGKSRRMGRDKALLPVSGHRYLWQRQLALLQELAPQRIFWSGFARDGLPPDLTVVTDLVPDAGPLAGIGACLAASESELLVVLAVDLPCMNAPFLERLLLTCTASRGAVTRWDGRFEPLAAVYPRTMLALARQHLAESRLALQDFVAAGVKAGCLEAFPVSTEDRPLFHNVNRPQDLSSHPTEAK